MRRTHATAVPAALALLTLTACLGEEGGGTTPINGASGDAGVGGTPSGNGGGDPSGGGGEPGAGGFQPVDCGSGFGETARRWSLPFPLVDSPGLASRSHLVMDLTGDGIPDLLVYEPSILPEPDARVGKAYWLVYPGGAEGFAAEPLRFTLPFSLETIGAVGEWSNQNFIITDLTGDTRPDFVVLRPEGDPDGDARVSRAWWLVYENTGTGFSTEAKRHALPYPLDADWQSAAFPRSTTACSPWTPTAGRTSWSSATARPPRASPALVARSGISTDTPARGSPASPPGSRCPST